MAFEQTRGDLEAMVRSVGFLHSNADAQCREIIENGERGSVAYQRMELIRRRLEDAQESVEHAHKRLQAAAGIEPASDRLNYLKSLTFLSLELFLQCSSSSDRSLPRRR